MTNNNTYIVTEFCETDLAAILKKRGCLREQEALRYLYDVLCGYEYMRNKGYIHRDFKPANILVKENVAKIADLGFSKMYPHFILVFDIYFASTYRIRESSIQEEYNIGSPIFMAPEALRNNIYSEKSDVWALGVVLFELVTGKAPFSGDSEAALLKNMVNLRLKREDTRISEKTWSIIKGCLTVDVANRLSLRELINLVRQKDGSQRGSVEGSAISNTYAVAESSIRRPTRIYGGDPHQVSQQPIRQRASEASILPPDQFVLPRPSEGRKTPIIMRQAAVPSQSGLDTAFARIDKVLINELNYTIFLVNLSEILDTAIKNGIASRLTPNDLALLPMIKYIVDVSYRVRTKKLSLLTLDKVAKNVYRLAEWKEYVKHPNFKTYLDTIAQFNTVYLLGTDKPTVPEITDTRFQKQVALGKGTKDEIYGQTESLILNFQAYLRRAIQIFLSNRNSSAFAYSPQAQSAKHQQVEQNLIVVDFLISVFQLNSLHIEYYQDPYSFACFSCLDVIVNGKIEISEDVAKNIIVKLQAVQI